MKLYNLISIETRLQADFTALAKNLGGDEATTQKWTKALISRYTEPQRHYHTIEHINSMLIYYKQYCYEIEDESVIKLAILFHDWIYDPRAQGNELESIKCFQEFADEMNLPQPMRSRVSEYIERTITHTLPIKDGEADSDLRLFLDFDLEVLSRNSTDYALYAEQIRQEYSHFTESDYCVGRIKVLEAFLERHRLYFSDAFHRMHEENARENLKGEIEMLKRRLKDSREACELL
jgi:predicted metal-dependent HD superfamily phosphohydrolase